MTEKQKLIKLIQERFFSEEDGTLDVSAEDLAEFVLEQEVDYLEQMRRLEEQVASQQTK